MYCQVIPNMVGVRSPLLHDTTVRKQEKPKKNGPLKVAQKPMCNRLRKTSMLATL